MLIYTNKCIIIIWVSPIETLSPKNGGRLAFLPGGTDCSLRIQKLLIVADGKEGDTQMLTIEGLIAVLCFGVTCFCIGYTFGRDIDKKQK